MDALRVGGRFCSVAGLLTRARLEGSMPVVERTIDDLTIEEWADQLGVTVETNELQLALNDFRKRYGLFSAAAANDWLSERGAALDQLASLLRPRVLSAKLAMRVVDLAAIERYYTEHRMDYDRAVLSMIATEGYGEARELLFRLEEGADFHALARAYSIDEASRPAGGYIGRVKRTDLPPEASGAVFGAKAGETLGPYEVQGRYLLYLVEGVEPACADEATTASIRELLFKYRLLQFQADLDIEESIWSWQGGKPPTGGKHT